MLATMKTVLGPGATLLQASEYIRDHLTRQRAVSRSMHEGEVGCRYRGDNGTMCAVGCLIPDELYKVNMENWPATHSSPDLGYIAPSSRLKHLFDGNPSILELRMLRMWQRYHDNEYQYGDWVEGRAGVSPAEFHENLVGACGLATDGAGAIAAPDLA